VKKRILFLHQVGVRGGAGTMLSNIISALDKDRFESVVVCPAGDVIPQLEDAGAKVLITPRPMHQFQHISGYSKSFVHPHFLHEIIMQWRDRSFWRDYIRKSGADIVHLNAVTLAPMAWSAREADTKVVCLVQETAVRGLVGLRTAWLRHIVSKWTDVVVFISEYDRHEWGCKAPCVEVVPNWVDFKKFDKAISKSDSRRQMDLPEDAKIILFMGGIEPIKGTLPLLQAVALLGDIGSLLLIIAGYSAGLDISGLPAVQRAHLGIRRSLGLDYHKEVSEFIGRHGLTDRLRFVGMTDKGVLLYAAADLVVFPAVSPHQARPVIEAGAMGKPVVVSDFESLREFVKNDRTGLTVPHNDAFALAKAIRRILGDSSLAARLGEGNYRMARAKHNLDINAPRFAAVYERLTVTAEANRRRRERATGNCVI
jgi:glycosyltransferase involved in cell wall biosynthesis